MGRFHTQGLVIDYREEGVYNGKAKSVKCKFYLCKKGNKNNVLAQGDHTKF